MRTWNSVFEVSFLQNGFQLVSKTLTAWYQAAKDMFADETPFFLQVEKELGYQQFQQWCSDLKYTLHGIQENITKGVVSSIRFQEENILSPFYYQEQLTRLAKKQTAFLNSVQEAKARLREQLESQSEVAKTYFYNDLINYLIVSIGKQNTEETLCDLLKYYKSLIEENLYQSIKNTIETFLEKTDAYYQTEENTLNPLPEVFIRQALREINVGFMKSHVKETPEGEQKETVVMRFSNALQDTTLALQNGLQDIIKKPKTLATIGATAALGYLSSISNDGSSNTHFSLNTRTFPSIELNWQGSLYQATNFINTFAVTYGINMASGNQAFAGPVSIVTVFSSFLQPAFSERIQTIESDVPNLSDEQHNSGALPLTKRQWNASQVPIVTTSFYTNIIGTYDTPHRAWGIVVSSNLAYVVDGDSGLQIINVSTPSAPTFVGNYDTQAFAWDVAVSGNFAYIADDTSGLTIVDISMPSAPVLVGGYNTAGNAFDVVVSSGLAYIADTSGLYIIDVSTPSVPGLISYYNTPDQARGLEVSSNFAYMAERLSGLQIIDVSTPSAPILVGNYNTPSDDARAVVLSGNLAYVAHYTLGLQIIDVSTPNTPTFVGNYTTPTSASYGIALSGNFVYLADNFPGLQVIDVSMPNTPVFVGNCDTPGQALDVFIAGNLAYVADYASGLQIVLLDFVPVLSVNALNITQGQSYILNNSNLLATDRDHSDNALTYVIDSLQQGLFQLRNNSSSVTEFTQQQVLNGDIEFVHDGSSMPPAYSVSVSDGIARTPPEVATINFSLSPVTTGATSITGSTGSPGTSSLPVTTMPSTFAVTTATQIGSTTTGFVTTNNLSMPTTTSNPTFSETAFESETDADILFWLLIAGLGTGSLLLCGLFGAISYMCYQKRRTEDTVELEVDLELHETLSPEREAKTHTKIGKKYALINKINQKEADALYQQTGLRFMIPEGRHKMKTTIDKGNFGKLCIAQNIQTQEYVAVKKIKGKEKIAVSEQEATLQLQVSKEPHIMPLLDSVKTIGSDEQPVLYQFMPLAGFGNGEALQKILQENTSVDSPWLILQFAQQLLQGFACLHAHRIAHLDFKLSNMVLNNQGKIFIIDFGCAQQYSKTSDLLEQSFGDARYYAPERLAFHRNRLPKNKTIGMPRAQDFPGRASDLWALGVSLLELSLGKYPFADCTTNEKFAYWNAEYFEKERETALNHIAETGESSNTRQALVTLLRGLLRTDPSQRLTAEEALAHPVFQEKAMAPNPKQITQVLTLLVEQNQAQAQRILEEQQKKMPVPKTQDSNYDRATLHYETGNENVSQINVEATFFDRHAQALQNIRTTSYEAMPSTKIKNHNVPSSNEETDSDENNDENMVVRLT